MMKFLGPALIGLLALAGCGATGERTLGESHRALVVANDGLLDDPSARAYVTRVAERVLEASPAAGTRARVFLLDTPAVNAFVLEGNLIYVTRGLMMLANDEAELAAVLAHEIAHLTARHPEARSQRLDQIDEGQVTRALRNSAAGKASAREQGLLTDIAGGLAEFSRAQEIEADRLGVDYLAGAGYAPQAAADFLGAMTETARIEARLAGRSFDDSRVEFLSSHPAGAQRLTALRGIIGPGAGGERGRDAHLDIIDGMLWGSDGDNGFIRGNTWIDPRSGLAIEIPRGLSVNITDFAVRAGSPDGRFLSFVQDQARGLTPTRYLTERVIPALDTSDFAGPPTAPRTRTVNGHPAAWIDARLLSLDGVQDLRIAVVEIEGAMLEFLMIAPANRPGAMDSLSAALDTVRIASPAERGSFAPSRLRVVTVRPGQGIAELAAMMQVDGLARERFLVLNNLDEGARLVAGQRVKIIAR